jgi:short chain dehydrogenase
MTASSRQFAATILVSLASAYFSSVHAFVGSSAFVPRMASRVASSSQLHMVAADAKVILVTGSSRGLGKSIALALGKEQQKVVINYVSPGSLAAAEATVAEVKALGGDAIAVQADSKCFCLP